MKRRHFIRTSGISAVAAGAAVSSLRASDSKKEMSNKFVHHVFFWLKEPENTKHHKRLRQALKDLVTIDSIEQYHLGVPADTRREVIDSSYHYSLLTFFPDKAAHDHYQDHSVHDVFRGVAGELCRKVVVYDSVDF